jgi:hypothetical protein
VTGDGISRLSVTDSARAKTILVAALGALLNELRGIFVRHDSEELKIKKSSAIGTFSCRPGCLKAKKWPMVASYNRETYCYPPLLRDRFSAN